MKIDIQAHDFTMTHALYEHITRRLGFALSNRDENIQRVMVRLTDINGPRGGEDKCCQIQVVLPHLADVIIQDTEVDIYTAINRAADRAGRTIGRRLDRQRDNSRSPIKHDINKITSTYEIVESGLN